MQAPTPVFFKKLRAIGLLLAAVSGALLGMSVDVPAPAIVTRLAAYIGLAGSMLSAVSQTAVEDVVKQQLEELPDE